MTCPHCSSDQYSINVTCANCGIIYKALPHWVGLTDEEVEGYWDWEDFQCGCGQGTLFEMVRAIEAKLKAKNT